MTDDTTDTPTTEPADEPTPLRVEFELKLGDAWREDAAAGRVWRVTGFDGRDVNLEAVTVDTKTIDATELVRSHTPDPNAPDPRL